MQVVFLLVKFRTLHSEYLLCDPCQCGDYHYILSYDTRHKYKSHWFRLGERGCHGPLLTLVTKITLYIKIYRTDC